MSKSTTSVGKRTALIIRCTAEEREMIREAAEREHRTISGYVLNAVMQRITIQNRTRLRFQKTFGSKLSKSH